MREHFHVPERYFLSHSVGCLPKRTADHLRAGFLAPWQTSGGNGWPDWMAALDQFRGGVGKLLGTAARHICPQVNVSSALTKLLFALPERSNRKTILCSQEDFPTIGFVLRQAERVGYRLRFVEGDSCDPVVWARAMDRSVALVHITHAFSNTSRLAPVAEICALARDAGAVSVVDIAQSAGIVPIHAPDWNADFLIGTGVKFLCFGPGAAFLYASEAMIETCEPLDVGWFSHENPFEMDIHQFRYASSAMRFFGGTPSPAPLVTANATLSLWDEVGLDAAQGRAQAYLSELASSVPEAMRVSPSDPKKRGGTLVIKPDNPERFKASLERANILFDVRREGFRFSVHGYTSDDDVEALKAALAILS